MIETGRLRLRAWRDADRESYLATCNTPAVTAHLGGPADTARIDAAIARVHASEAANGFSFWAIERIADAELLGYCGLKRAEDSGTPIEGNIEAGWRLREDAWGQGYATEAGNAALAWGFANLPAARIVALTRRGNDPSIRLAERLGMRRRTDLEFDTGQLVYAVDRAEFERGRGE